MKKLFLLFAMMTFTVHMHAVISYITYDLIDSYGDGWNGAAISIVDAATGTEWASLTIASGSANSGTVRLVSDKTYNIVWKSGNYDSECSFTLADSRGVVFCMHNRGASISAGTLAQFELPTKGDVNGDGEANISDVMDVVNFVLTGETSSQPPTPPAPAEVEISYELWDSYGDGWNGAAIIVVDPETNEEVGYLTIDDGDYASGTLTLTAGHHYEFIWQTGAWDAECTFNFYDSAGEILYEWYGEIVPEPWPDPDELVLAMAKKAKTPIPFMPKIAKAPVKVMPKKAKAPARLAGRKLPPRPKKETTIPVEDYGELMDGEVFFSYLAPDDASSLPVPTAKQLRDINGDGEVNIADVMDQVGVVLYGVAIPDIEVSTGSETVEILVGSPERYNHFEITNGSGNFEIVSSDPDKLKVHASGLSYSMYSTYLGTYTVTITDKDTGKTKAIQVIVKEAEACCPDDHHPHMIDLGLPSGTKWACCNVDATKPEAFGGYYAWGETAEKSDYSWATYTHCDGSEATCHDLGTSINGTKYDVAHAKWGGNWYMPTYDQVRELFNYMTTFSLTTMNGVRGAFFTFPNGNNIFLPCGGWKEGTELRTNDSNNYETGNFWLGNLPSQSKGDYLDVLYHQSGTYGYGYFLGGNHSLGYNVRPVSTPKAPFAISTTTALEMELGSSATVEVTAGNGNYEASSSDANVAAATVSGSVVSIVGAGVGTATVTVKDTATGQTKSFSVTVSSPITVEPDYVSFGVVLPNTVTTREMVVTNTGTAAKTLTVSAQAPFTLEGGTSSRSISLAANASTTVKAVFTSGTAGDYFGNLSIAYGDATLKVPVQASCVNSLDDQMVIERKYWIEYGGDYCYPGMTLNFSNSNVLTIGYYATEYWDGGYLYDPFTGIHILSGAGGDGGDPNYRTKDWNVAPVVEKQWVREKVVIKKDGNVKYYMNGELKGEQLFDKLDLGSVTSMTLTVTPYGWWTGHKHYMDNFGIYTPTESYCDNFNDGQINLDFWQTPFNPSGVREEDGIVKLEQLQTDQDFNLRTKTLTLNFGSGGSTAYLSCPDDHHPHMIDLGLPSGTKWSCCNVGASKPEDFGGYYHFGDVSTAPSLDQIHELMNQCSYKWTTLNGVKGGQFTGPSGGMIFLPAAGGVWFDGLGGVGDSGDYWTSTPYDEDSAYNLGFDSDDSVWDNSYYYHCSVGLSVRPVSSASSASHLQLSISDDFPLMEGETAEIEILSGSGNYRVEFNNYDGELGGGLEEEENIIYITGLLWGEAVVTVTDLGTGESVSFTVSVYQGPPPFSLSEESLTLDQGETATVEAYDGSGNYTVESSDEHVATAEIDADGNIIITGNSNGTATITVYDVEFGGSASLEVTVTKNDDGPAIDYPL